MNMATLGERKRLPISVSDLTDPRTSLVVGDVFELMSSFLEQDGTVSSARGASAACLLLAIAQFFKIKMTDTDYDRAVGIMSRTLKTWRVWQLQEKEANAGLSPREDG